MATHLRTELVLDALHMALWQRRPEEVIHHSDQGSQDTSIAFGLRCKEHRRHSSLALRVPDPVREKERSVKGGPQPFIIYGIGSTPGHCVAREGM